MSIVIDVETKDSGSKSKLTALNKQLSDLFTGSKKAQGGLDSIGGMKPGASQSVRQTNAALKDMAKTDLSRVNKDLGQLSKVAGNAQTAVVGLGIAFAGFAALKSLQGTIDGFISLQNNLKTISSSLGEVERRTERAFAIASNARAGIGATVGVFSDFARALDQLNVSDTNLFRATSVIQKGVALSPGSKESAEAAIFQLRQGLSSGVLRGQELNSVLEQLPFIGQGIAKSLKLSTGELRSFAEQGKLTSQVVLKALLDIESSTNATFAKTSFRLADSLKFLSEAISVSAGTVLSAFPNKASNNLVEFAKKIFNFAGTLRAVIPIAREQYTAFIAGLRDTSFSQSLKGFSDGTKSLLSPFREIAREKQLEDVVAFFDRLSARLKNFSLGNISTTLFDIPRLFTELQRTLLTVSATLFGIFDGIRLNAPRILLPVRSFFSSAAIEAKIGSIRLAAAATQGSRDLSSAIGSLFESATGGGFSDRRAVFDFMAIFKAGSLKEFNTALLDFSRNFRSFDKSLTKRFVLSLTNTANDLSAQIQRVLQFSGILDPRFLFANNFSSNAFVSFISAIYKQFLEVPLLRFLAILQVRLKAAVDLFLPAIANIFDQNTGQKFGTLLADTIKFVVSGITAAITGSSGPFSDLAVAVINGLKVSFIAVLKFLRGAITGFIDTLTGGSQVGDFFNRVFGETTLLTNALDNINKFGRGVKDIFYDVYDAVVGNSYWPDTIDEVVAYARGVTGAAGPIEKMLNRVQSTFRDVFEFVKKNIEGTRIGDFVISVAADFKAIDFGAIFRNLASQFSAILISAVSIAYGGLGARLLGIFSIASLINTSADGALTNISKFIGTELGFAAQQFGENLIDGITLAIKALIVAAPAFIDGLLSGFGPLGEVAKFLSQFVFGFTNTVFQAALVLSAGLAIFSDTFRKTATTFLLGGKGKKGAKEKGAQVVEGVADGLLPGFLNFLNVGTAAVNTSIIKQKQFGILALASFAATATGFLDVFQGITTTLPLLGIALLGPDGGRVLLIKLTKVLREFFVSAVTQVTAFTGAQDFFVGIAKQLVGVRKTAVVQGQKFGFAFSKAAEGDIANVFGILSKIPGNFAKGQAQFISDKNFGFADLFFGPKGADSAINAIDDAQGELFSRLATTGPKAQGELFDFSEAPVKLPKGGLEGLKGSLLSLKEQAKTAIGDALANARIEFKKLGPAFSSTFEAISRNSRRAFSAVSSGFTSVVERAKVAGAAVGRFSLLLKVGLVGGLLLAASAASASEAGLNGMVNSLIAADGATLALAGALGVLGLAAFSTSVLNVLSNVTRLTTAIRESRVALLATEALSAVVGSNAFGRLANGFNLATSALTGYIGKAKLAKIATAGISGAGNLASAAGTARNSIFTKIAELTPTVLGGVGSGIKNIFSLVGKLFKLPFVGKATTFGIIGTILFGLFGPGSGFANNISGLFDKILGFLGIVEKTGAGKINSLNKFASRQSGLPTKDKNGKPVDDLRFNITAEIAAVDVNKLPEEQFVVLKDSLSKNFDEITEIQTRAFLKGFPDKADSNRLAELVADQQRLLARLPQQTTEGLPAESKKLKDDLLSRQLSSGSIIRAILPGEISNAIITDINDDLALLNSAFTFIGAAFKGFVKGIIIVASIAGSALSGFAAGGPIGALIAGIGTALYIAFEDTINDFFVQLGGIKDSILQGLFLLLSDPPSKLAKQESGTIDAISELEKYYTFLDKAEQDRFLAARSNYSKDLRALDALTKNGFQGQFGSVEEYRRQVALLTKQFNNSRNELLVTNREFGAKAKNRKITNDLTESLKPISSAVSANLGVDFGASFEKLFTPGNTISPLFNMSKEVDQIKNKLKETFNFEDRQALLRRIKNREAVAKSIQEASEAFAASSTTISFTAKLLNEDEINSSFERALSTSSPQFRKEFARTLQELNTAKTELANTDPFGDPAAYEKARQRVAAVNAEANKFRFPAASLEAFNKQLGDLKLPTLEGDIFSNASIESLTKLNARLSEGKRLSEDYQAKLKLVGQNFQNIDAAREALKRLNKELANDRAAIVAVKLDAISSRTPQQFISDQIAEGINVQQEALSSKGGAQFKKLTENVLKAEAAINAAKAAGTETNFQPLIDDYAKASKALSEFGQKAEKVKEEISPLSVALEKLSQQEGLSVGFVSSGALKNMTKLLMEIAKLEEALGKTKSVDEYRKKLQELIDKQNALDEAVSNSAQTFDTAFSRINEAFGVNLTPIDLASSIDISGIAEKANAVAFELRKAIRDGVKVDSDAFRSLQATLKDALLRGEIVSAITTLGRNLELSLTDGATKSFRRIRELSREIDPGEVAFGRRGRNDQTSSRAGLEVNAQLIDLLENSQLSQAQNDVITDFLKTGSGNPNDLNALIDSFKEPIDPLLASSNTVVDRLTDIRAIMLKQPLLSETTKPTDTSSTNPEDLIVVTASKLKADVSKNLEALKLQNADLNFENLKANVGAANSPLNKAKLANTQIDPNILNFAKPESLKKFTDIGLKIAELDKILAQSVITGEDVSGVATARQRYINQLQLLTEGVVNLSERAFAAGQQFASDVNQALNSNIKDIFKSGKSLKDAFGGVLSSIANGILDSSIDRITDLITGKGGLLDGLLTSIGGGTEGLLAGLFGGKKKDGGEVIAGLGAGLIGDAIGGGGKLLGGLGGLLGGGGKKEENILTSSFSPLNDTNLSLDKTFSTGTDVLGKGLDLVGETTGDLAKSIPDLVKSFDSSKLLKSGGVQDLAAQGLGFLIGSLFADGGPISGPGTGKSDNILIGASNGEYMINAASTRKHRKLIEAINKDNLATFLDGQVVPPSTVELPVPVPSAGLGGGIVRGGDTYNLQITGDVSRQTRKEIITMLPTIATGVNGFNKEKGIA